MLTTRCLLRIGTSLHKSSSHKINFWKSKIEHEENEKLYPLNYDIQRFTFIDRQLSEYNKMEHIGGEWFRTESSVPFSSCHLPIQNVCNASMGIVYDICIQYIPYGGQFSWLFWPEITWFELVSCTYLISCFWDYTFFLKIGFVWPPKPCCLRS